MRSRLHSHSTARHSTEDLLNPLLGRGHLLFDHHFARFVQHTVVRVSIAQIHSNRQLLLVKNLLPLRCDGASFS
jgi:hypothetical protein